MAAPHRKLTLLVFIALFIAALPLHAEDSSSSREQSSLHFAQQFYTWYAAQVARIFKTNQDEVPWHAALKYHGNPFTPELTKALLASDAEAKAEGDPVLDFDPILNSQDPADKYVVRHVNCTDAACIAEVYGVWSRPVPNQGDEPQVVAEIVFKNGRWKFANFRYPNSTSEYNENLLSILSYHYQR